MSTAETPPIRILHVEDNPVAAKILDKAIEDATPPMELIHSGKLTQAIQRFDNDRFDVVLLDLGLPDSQGLDTVRKAKSSMPDVPIVVLTGADEDGLGVRCVQEGMQDFLVKGRVDGAGLRNVIRYAIERRGQEDSLRADLRQARKMEVVGRMAGGIVHDFNNLLAMMGGYATLLKDSLDPGDRRRADADEICKTVDRAASLTRQLLSFSRKRQLKPSALDLNVVVVDMQKMLRRLIRENVDLEITLATDPCAIRADTGQMEEILLNLAINACDAMPRGGALHIETKRVEIKAAGDPVAAGAPSGPYILLRVSDTGCGMTEEMIPHIFEPFFTTKGPGSGTGLGLSMVQDIVRGARGHIIVNSQPGKGSAFQLYFPHVGEVAQVRDAADAAVVSPKGSETVLIIDEDPGIRAVVHRALTSFGYRVLEATSDEEALQHAREHPRSIDLVILDLLMPGASGVELAKKILQMRPTAKTLFISGHTPETLSQAELYAPPEQFMAKPFDSPTLARRVRDVLDC